MDIISYEIRNSERLLLTVSIGVGVTIWVYTLWRTRVATKKATRLAYDGISVSASVIKPQCQCHRIEPTDDCGKKLKKSKVPSDEEETDTDPATERTGSSASPSSSSASSSSLSLAVTGQETK
ncbi:unnamed protein product [Caenorhabditis bovis]|uniref:Uncharacterized protein n=1 Tax=Caenorhabditis bovis TaxID=2654633 RepID=A0A8S1F1F1_9PELO|nr:unnamed protein product [Caenorhabditis bovis]